MIATTALILVTSAYSASAPSSQRQLQERQVHERLDLSAQQQVDLRRLRVALDEDEASFRRRQTDERNSFENHERWSLKSFDSSLRGTPRLEAKQRRREFDDRRLAARKQFDAEQRRRRLEFYETQRRKLHGLRVVEAEQKRQLLLQQRGARELEAAR